MFSDPARPLLRWQRSLVLALVALVALAAVLVSIFVIRAQADRRADSLARQATDVSAAVVQALKSGLSGGAGLVGADGPVATDAFDAYAREVVDESPAEALALITVVDDADRAEFEQSLGTEIRDEVDGGPAGRRDQYYVVTRVTPMTETNKVLVGVDLSMDPVRSDAIERALASGETVISAPLGSLPTGRPAVFVAKPLYRPGDDGSPRMEEPVGLVTTGYQGLRTAGGDHRAAAVGDPAGAQ